MPSLGFETAKNIKKESESDTIEHKADVEPSIKVPLVETQALTDINLPFPHNCVAVPTVYFCCCYYKSSEPRVRLVLVSYHQYSRNLSPFTRRTPHPTPTPCTHQYVHSFLPTMSSLWNLLFSADAELQQFQWN